MYKDDNVKSLVELTLEYSTERAKTSGELDCICTKRLHIPIQPSNSPIRTLLLLSVYPNTEPFFVHHCSVCVRF